MSKKIIVKEMKKYLSQKIVLLFRYLLLFVLLPLSIFLYILMLFIGNEATQFIAILNIIVSALIFVNFFYWEIPTQISFLTFIISVISLITLNLLLFLGIFIIR